MTRRISGFVTALLLLGAGCVAAPSPPQPSTAGPSVQDVPAPSATRLDLSGKALTVLPSSVLARTDLTELDVSDNRIGGALPAEIGRLSALRVLDASSNLMTGLPAEVGRLSALRVLDLSDNNLTGLPHELGNLKNLVTLDLRGNDVSSYDLDVIRAGIPDAEILID